MGKKVTEKDSYYNHLEKMSIADLLHNINKEDKTVAFAVEKVLPQIEILAEQIIEKLKNNGRLFYIGAGTSGRLGFVDAAECPPTYGIEHGIVIGLMAGGESAMRKAVEFAEDDFEGGWNDLQKHNVSKKDIVIGIAASGYTPYVVGAVQRCNENKILTGAITCNPNSPLSKEAKFPVEVVVGPEFVTGSTRMKAGTAQKLVLNMISTTVMIKLNRVKGNKMVDMQLTNNKLLERGTKMIIKATGLAYQAAKELLNKSGSVRKAIEQHSK